MSRFGWVLLSCSLLLLLPLAAEAHTVEVTASGLNIRTGPSTGYGRIGVARRGERLPALGRSGSWVKVSFRGREGWGYGRYLRDVRRGTSGSGSTASSSPGSTSRGARRIVTASRLNVRSGPSTRYRRLGQLSRGDSVRVVGRSGDWRRIARSRGGQAWVHGAYLRRPGASTGANGSGTTSSSGRSRAGFIQLPSSGPGYYGYYAGSKRWGTPRLVYGIQRVARRFMQRNPGAPRLGVGDLSLRNGGDIAGHASHERGVDADLRPVRNDGREAPVTIYQSAYSRPLTQDALQLFEDELQVTHIFFNDTSIRGVPHRQNWPNHANHFHVRIR